ncbi:MAG: hypothetical protein J7519_02465, partial [Roseofilum sp. SID1]
MSKKCKRNHVKAHQQGLEDLKNAQEETKEINKTERPMNYYEIAEDLKTSRDSIARFFRGECIRISVAKSIIKFLGLEFNDVINLDDLKDLGDPDSVTLLLNTSIDEFLPQADKILEILKEMSGDRTITIRVTKPGSAIVVLEGLPEGLRRIEELFEAGELQEIAGFPVLDVYLEWEEEPTRLRDWFQGVFTEGWQRAEELLTPEQLHPVMVWSDRTQRAKFYDLSVDLLQCQVVLLINLIQEEEERAIANLKVYPRDAEFLPVNLKMTILAEGEVFKEVTARAAD